MGSPAEIPHADEDLKSLVVRFKEAPGSSAFTELAAALLVRGHAAEALRIAEHGLQLIPQSVDGRIERAAALLALGRPRVAYVELKRALAINPTNRKAMRLLGKVYVDVGVPTRAAELLAQRFKSGDAVDDNEQEATHVTQAPFPMGEPEVDPNVTLPQQNPAVRADTEPLRKNAPIPSLSAREDKAPPQIPSDLMKTQHDGVSPNGTPLPPPNPKPPLETGAAIPDLFSDLTRDLGLAVPQQERPQSRVEVTQVIRRRGVARPRSDSELQTIEGPIVDTTQPGKVQESNVEPNMVSPPSEPPPLFDAVTSPRLHLAPFGLDDEPLFQEHMPFAVRPVESDKEADKEAEVSSDMHETIDEDAPPELDSALMRAALEPTDDHKVVSRFSDSTDTLVDQIEAADGPEKLPTAVTSPPAPTPLLNAREVREVRDKSDELTPEVQFEPPMPLLELSRGTRRSAVAPRLELVTPKAKPLHIALAVAGVLFMIGYLILLLLAAPPAWAPKVPLFSQDAQGHGAQAGDRSKEARSSR